MKIGLSGKLIFGFLGVAIVTLLVGVVGWYGLTSTSTEISQLGRESIPAITNMEIVKVNQMQIKVILRTLTSPYLTDADYKLQMDKLDAARAAYGAALAEYDPIFRTPEEDKLYKTFQTTMAISKADNNKFLAMYKQFRDNTKMKPEDASRTLTDLANSGETSAAFDNMMNSLQALLDYIKAYYGKTLVDQAINQANLLNALMVSFAAAGVLIALLLGIFLSRSISQPIVKVTGELREASKSLESASLQVSSSSQELSSGSSELASSIEEMTSSLEELQSIIESNTKNVNQSEHLMQETSSESLKVTDRMAELKTQLADIAGNSKKISKIIKVIDDIAFQTNILALNAAVEAARAGDAGKGFAVVADQVKSLAQKSAEAAKETADLIEIAMDSVAKGEGLGQIVVDAQVIAVDKAGKVAVLLDEVNRASKEQLKGANQINQAVAQINSIVQTTASSSEENAAAGEELLSQAESLGGNVSQLNFIITGQRDAAVEHAAQTAARPSHQPGRAQVPASHLPQLAHPAAGPKKAGIEVTKPEDVIPLHDFKDY
jgi:methyl-accepting chemotaxis protein